MSCQPKKTYKLIDYEDDYDFGVIALECDHLPDEKVADESPSNATSSLQN